jgi:hypothetical protein
VAVVIYMFKNAIRYPYDDGEGLRALAIGGVLTLLSFLVFPVFLLGGYTVRVLPRVADGDEHLPAFEDPADLFVDGLKAFVVGFAYLVVPVVLVTAAIVAVFVPFASPVPTWVTVLAWVVALLSVPTTVAALYVLPAGLVNFARTGRVGAAFVVRDLWPALKSGSYLLTWLLAIVVLSVSSAVTGVLGVVTVVGFVLAAFVGFYANLVAAYLYARGFAEAVPVAVGTDGETAGVTA